MPFSLKQLLIFIISAILFAGAVYLVDTDLLNIVQARFYNPSVINSVTKENSRDAEIVQSHISELQLKFATSLSENAVRNSFLHNQNAEDIFERSRIFGILMESTGGLQSVQFVDSNGIRIHYSTSARDVLSQSRDSTSYRNYNENAYVLPFDMVNVPSNGGSKFLMDDINDRIIFSYPFRDSMDVYRGTALFTVSIRALAERLIAEGSLKASDTVSLIRTPPGIVFGTPDTSKAEILSKISSIWGNGILDAATLDAEDSGAEFALLSTKTGQGIFLGRLVNNALFTIPEYMRIILLLSLFLTFFLAAVFIVNLKPDPAIQVQNRINKLRKNLFSRLDEDKLNREKFIFELEQRRSEIHSELKQKLKISRGKEKKIDALIDKLWNELLAEIMVEGGEQIIISREQITKSKEIDEIEKTEEIGDVEEIEEVEEIDEIEEIVETGEAEEVDEIEEFEEIGEAEVIGEAEELGEAEEFEEIDEVEEIEEIAEAEEVEEAGEIEEIEEFEDIEEIEEIGEEFEAEVPARAGLLAKASGMEHEEAGHETPEPAPIVLTEDSPSEESSSAKNGGGLLERASTLSHDQHEEDEPEAGERPARGLLALASEIEFNSNIPAGSDEDAAELKEDVEIVSPFSSMFTSLDD